MTCPIASSRPGIVHVVPPFFGTFTTAAASFSASAFGTPIATAVLMSCRDSSAAALLPLSTLLVCFATASA
jgi:hypothetical protein